MAERSVKERERRRDWRKANRQHRREYERQWKLDNPDRVSAYSLAHRKQILSPKSPEDRRAIAAIYRAAKSSVACACSYCGKITVAASERHVDHRLPGSRGGDHSRDNLAITCSDCNLRKHAKTELEFLQQEHSIEPVALATVCA